MTHNEAIEELMFHSGEHPNIDDPRWRNGFLSMDDAGTHGGYVHAGRLAEATKTYGYFKRVKTDNPRAIDSLPSILQEVEPIEVSVSHDAVSLSWHAVGHGYGYSLIVLRDAEGEEARNLRQRDRSFNRSVELAPGVWSNYPYH